MLNFKSFGKVLVSMICLACVLLVNPVSALSTSSSLVSVDPGVVAPAPETSLENLITSPSGHLVSLVRQSSYTSAIIRLITPSIWNRYRCSSGSPLHC